MAQQIRRRLNNSGWGIVERLSTQQLNKSDGYTCATNPACTCIEYVGVCQHKDKISTAVGPALGPYFSAGISEAWTVELRRDQKVPSCKSAQFVWFFFSLYLSCACWQTLAILNWQFRGTPTDKKDCLLCSLVELVSLRQTLVDDAAIRQILLARGDTTHKNFSVFRSASERGIYIRQFSVASNRTRRRICLPFRPMMRLSPGPFHPIQQCPVRVYPVEHLVIEIPAEIYQ